jgi:Sec-independent protein translocase protein TatA
VFGVGPQELIVVVILVLVVFGPVKAAGVARDLGRFAGEARGQSRSSRANSLLPLAKTKKKTGGLASLAREAG